MSDLSGKSYNTVFILIEFVFLNLECSFNSAFFKKGKWKLIWFFYIEVQINYFLNNFNDKNVYIFQIQGNPRSPLCLPIC